MEAKLILTFKVGKDTEKARKNLLRYWKHKAEQGIVLNPGSEDGSILMEVEEWKKS